MGCDKLSKDSVPDDYHFIFGLAPDFGGKPFSMIHYIALASCHAVNRPKRINFYYAHEPSGPWWEKAKPLVNLIKISPPREIFGNPLEHPAHKSDVIRLQILLERGGVYLDMDVVCLRPFKDLLQHDLVLAEERNVGLCNAVIIARPGAEFLQHWLASYRTFDHNDWNAHSVRLPRQLADGMPHLVHILDHRKFFWPSHDRTDLRTFFLSEGSAFCKDSYCVHLWESLTWNFLGRLTPEHLLAVGSEFCLLTRKYVERL